MKWLILAAVLFLALVAPQLLVVGALLDAAQPAVEALDGLAAPKP